MDDVSLEVARSSPLTSEDLVDEHLDHAATAEPLAGRWRVFAICAIALFMASLDNTIVATALPRIGGALHARINWLAWTITIYSLGSIVMLPLAGRISDQFGRKKLFVACAVVFTISSVLCGLSTSIYMLIPLRLLQALGGGGFLPSASGIVADHFGRDRDRALGMFSSIFPIGSIAGPVFGGLIAEFWDWRGIFFVNLPIGVILIVLVVRFVPSSGKREGGQVDVLGVLLMALTIVCGMLTITALGESKISATDPLIIVPAIGAIGLGWLFMRHVGASDHPIIPPRLIKGKGFAMMNTINVLLGGAGFGFGVLVPLYAENRYHIGLSSAGTILSSQAIGMTCIAAIASMSLRKTGYRWPMTVGFVFVSVTLVFLSFAARGMSPYWWLSLFSLLSGLGLGCIAPAANNATMKLAPEHVAAVSGLRATFRQSGQILCISTITSIVARSADPGLAQAHVLLILAALLVLAAGLTFRIPDHRGGW